MKIREILEGDVIPFAPRRDEKMPMMPRARLRCPGCGEKMRGGTDVRTHKRVKFCTNCFKTIDEHATLVLPQGGKIEFPDEDKRKRLQRVLKTMKELKRPREEQLRQVKSYKLFKAIEPTENEERTTLPNPKQYRKKLQTKFGASHAQGMDAFRAGMHRDDNPHKTWQSREAWFAGWDEQARNKAS
jgi:ribosome modulation factor